MDAYRDPGAAHRHAVNQDMRRRFLLHALRGGALVLAAPLPLVSVARALGPIPDTADALKPTPWNQLGPFYKRDTPHRAILRRPGDPGLPLRISGTVRDVAGRPLPQASLQVWQANAAGYYDTVGDRYRATLQANQKGAYILESVLPGHYPARVCQHVHFLVQAAGHEALVTQMYFATDPVFEGDPDGHYHRDPLITSPALIRPVTLVGNPDAMRAEVRFDLVLEKA